MFNMAEPTASAAEILLSLMNASPRPTLEMARLVRGGRLLGLTENNVRVTVSRLRSRGLLESTERGRYQLGDEARIVAREVRTWRTRHRRVRARWRDGYVLALLGDGGTEARPGPRRARSMRLAGFRRLAPRVHVRPDNLRGGIRWLRAHFDAAALEAPPTLARVHDTEPAWADRVAGLYDRAGLNERYRRYLERLRTSLPRLATLPTEDAMRESFFLGREVTGALIVDPLLPAALVDVERRDALFAAMIEYDDLARPLWVDAMEADA